MVLAQLAAQAVSFWRDREGFTGDWVVLDENRRNPVISSTQSTNWITAVSGVTSMRSSSPFIQTGAGHLRLFPGAQGCWVRGQDIST